MRLDGWAKGAIRQLQPAAREHFVLDPIEMLRGDLGLTVQEVDHLNTSREDGGACDGVSYLDDGVVLFAPSRFSKRQNFTLAHELGHWLVEQDEKLLDWLADQDNAGVVLENLCDVIAQHLLLPDDLISSVISTPVRAQDILDLSDQSAASVPASAIAVAGRLPRLGAAVIIDPTSGIVLNATVHPDPEMGWPVVYPWPGDQLPDQHPLRILNPGSTLTRKSFWRSRWGRREDFYIDAVAVAVPNRVIAILSSTDIWRTETLSNEDTRDWDRRPVAEIFCCGQNRQVRGWPCPTCGRQFCPVCGQCNCTKRRRGEGECQICHTLVGEHLLVDGVCELHR